MIDVAAWELLVTSSHNCHNSSSSPRLLSLTTIELFTTNTLPRLPPSSLFSYKSISRNFKSGKHHTTHLGLIVFDIDGSFCSLPFQLWNKFANRWMDWNDMLSGMNSVQSTPFYPPHGAHFPFASAATSTLWESTSHLGIVIPLPLRQHDRRYRPPGPSCAALSTSPRSDILLVISGIFFGGWNSGEACRTWC